MFYSVVFIVLICFIVISLLLNFYFFKIMELEESVIEVKIRLDMNKAQIHNLLVDSCNRDNIVNQIIWDSTASVSKRRSTKK